ncbi:hypothetical protein HJC23_008732 [Cyclotella cryptica]|uniref:phosphoethanolamine N-methyltransferase n=1 Tax=Cyclotella cryptica TaxID=29204 RepID=A0ABD3PD55_9STRA
MSNLANINSNDAIKTMKLYTHVDRIKTELTARGLLSQNPIDPIVLSEIDSMHYLGNAAIEAAVAAMGLTASSKVLDVGSGFGGPARILSSLTKCHVVALELQQDIHDLGAELTRRCKLSDSVDHVSGDILEDKIGQQLGYGVSSFDAIVSYLVFLHIPNKGSVLDVCRKLLKPNGTLFVEDFFCISPFTKVEVESLARDVFCKDLPSREEYIQQLELSGYKNIQFIDMTTEWTQCVTKRLEHFIANKDGYVKVHGEEAYSGLLEFYAAIAALFSGGNLGGVRIVAQMI